MSWKDWPSWLKGGVILAGLMLALYLLAGLISLSYLFQGIRQLDNPSQEYLAKETTIESISKLLQIPLMSPTMLISNRLTSCANKNAINSLKCNGTIVVQCILFYFILGAIIGWLVGKIKLKKAVNKKKS